MKLEVLCVLSLTRTPAFSRTTGENSPQDTDRNKSQVNFAPTVSLSQ